VIIRDFFRDRREGVFVDVGCAYPRMYSTTYFLENHLDWSGIGIDAVASYAEAWATERPRSKFLNYFVTDRSGAMERFYLADYRPISSSKKEMVEGKKYKEIRVPGATLNHILEQSGIAKVDFLSMDIEGGQLAALHGFDIAKYRPDLACIEDYVPDRNAIFAYFEQNDYELLEDYRRFDMVNWYFAPRNRPPHPPWEPPARDPSTVMGADGLPAGSYRDSCRGCRWVDDSLACECRRISGEYVAARADTACGRGFANRDGNLACEG
jgi:FkbM family methyltransferase